jgi:hypothetical protein
VRRLILAGALLLFAARAGAVEYELPIDIESEEDLYELLFSEEISEESFNALLELLRRGVDLSKADAEELYALPGLTLQDVDGIVAYREAAGGIPDPGALFAAGVLTDEKLLAIAPFLVVSRAAGADVPPVAGRARLRGVYTTGDGRLPPVALEGRASTLRNLHLALALVVARNDIGDLRYDTGRDALSAAPRATRLRVPKFYAAWRTPKLDLLAGTYTAGFGQRLTFDETSLYTPNGIYPDAVVSRDSDLVRECIESMGELGETPCPAGPRRYVTPDFDWRDTLLGVAVSARQLETGSLGWFQLSAWGSAQPRDIYQYELYDRGRCEDPTDDGDSDCLAPDVFRRDEVDPTAPSSEISFQTLPNLWVELLGGANVSWFGSRRGHVGVTAWGAQPRWLVGGIDLDFQEWSRFPRGGTYGAVGLDAAWGRSWYDLGVEATRSFDGGTGGDLGVLARATATWPRNELELSFRWYGDDFVNPHTGAIAEADEVDGQRARDELGVRLRYGGKLSRRLSVRALASLWEQPSTNVRKARVEARGDFVFTRQLAAGLFARWSDKDLSEAGHAQCYELPIDSVAGEPVPCKGQKIDVGASATISPARKMSVKLQGQIRFIDDGDPEHYPEKFRMDAKGWAMLNWWFTDDARLRARVGYERPDLEGRVRGDTFLEHQLWSYLMLTYRLPRTFLVSARYELRAYFDEELRMTQRSPSPEHWLALDVEARF